MLTMDGSTSLAALLGLGFLLGVQHATDPDHLAAVSTLASRHRGIVRSALLGGFWGAGHTLALLAAGAVTVTLRLTISPAVAQALEELVGVMLIVLGAQVVVQTLGATTVHRHAHAHGGEGHAHLHVHVGGHTTHEHPHLLRLGARPFLVGLVHGLAGSAALTLLVVSTVSSPLGAVLYIVVFGVGSTAGMLVLSGLLGLPFAFASRHSAALHRLLRLAAGSASLGLGVWLARDLL
jgi:ABC-type nickel/cobalt efflux system permease component RcnA